MALKRKIFGWDSMDVKERQAIINRFTFKDPKAFFSEAVRRGYVDGTICLMDKKTGEIPFGLRKMVDEWDVDPSRPLIKVKNLKPIGMDDRPYQVEALETFFKRNFGIIKVSTGGGKTVVAREAIRAVVSEFGVQGRCMFLVDQLDLVTQAKTRFEEKLPYNIGIYKNGSLRDWRDKQIIITTIQTLQTVLNREVKKTKTYRGRKVKKDNNKYEAELKKSNDEKQFLSELLTNIDFLIIDEVQEFGSESRSNLILDKFTNVNWLMALSATPFRKADPIAKKRIIGFTGDVVYTVKEQTLVDSGHLAKRRVLFIYHEGDIDPYLEKVNIKKVRKNVPDHKKEFDENGVEIPQYIEIPNYNQFYKSFITNNKNRNHIAKLVMECLEEFGRNSLCLVTKIEHGEKLSKITGHPFVDGGSNEVERDEQLNKLQKGENKILIASNIFNKGTDIPAINFVFNVGAGKGEEITRQKKGRVLRKVPGNPLYDKAMIIDFYDNYNRTFDEHSDFRLKSYEEDISDDDNLVFVEYMGRDSLFKKQLKIELKEWFNK